MRKPRLQVSHLRSCALLAAAVIWNCIVYNGSQFVRWLPQQDWTLPIDRQTPFLPWTVSIYFGCFLFWAINYYLISRQEKSHAYRLFCADFLSRGVCLLFFLFLPTTNLRPEVVGTGLWETLMRLLYQIDAPVNLFPSIHCLVSWLCWVGVRRQESIPRWYRCFSFWMAAAVCLSTLTTKQHVVADVLGGIALAEICWQIASWKPVASQYTRIVERIL